MALSVLVWKEYLKYDGCIHHDIYYFYDHIYSISAKYFLYDATAYLYGNNCTVLKRRYCFPDEETAKKRCLDWLRIVLPNARKHKA